MSSRKPVPPQPQRPSATSTSTSTSRHSSDKSGTGNENSLSSTSGNRRRSNSQSQVVTAPSFLANESGSSGSTRPTLSAAKTRPQKRHQAEFYVTLASLNDTFATKTVHVPFFPETCKLGRPTGTKVKPHVTNGYFDSRVLSRNHACMFIDAKSGRVMVQDMGSSNGTFVNQEKLGAEPVPVNVGDTLNLGFNIQVETSHKQISAKIEAINVVSNSPQGPVHAVFPRLTKSALSNFGDAEMRHYEFIQQLCAELAPDPSSLSSATSTSTSNSSVDDAESDPKRQAARAFDYGMFSDIVPSLDEMFENSASHQNADAGLYPNSGLRTAPELLSTLDYLSASLARIKQQNSILASLDVFLQNYAASVDDINTRHVKEQVKKHKCEQEASIQKEREKLQKSSRDHEAKLVASDSRVSMLESEIAQLKAELHTATHQINETPNLGTEKLPLKSSDESLPLDKETSVSVPNLFPEPPIAEEINSTTLGSAHISEDMAAETAQITEVPTDKQIPNERLENVPNNDTDPYMKQLNHVIGPYKNQGMLVGIMVVIAGLIYQNSKST